MTHLDHVAAEQIIDIVRAAHTSRDQAVALVATKLSSAWCDGFTTGTRSVVDAQHRIMDRFFNPRPDPNGEVQADHQEERDDGWSVR